MTAVHAAQYLIAIHTLACLTVLYQFSAVGLIIDKTTPRHVRALVYGCLTFPILQVGLSVVRFSLFGAPNAVLDHPFDYFVDFIWSPMLTVVLIWVAQLYLFKYCKQLKKIQPANRILSPVRPKPIIAAIMLGVLSGGLAQCSCFGEHTMLLGMFLVANVLSFFELTVQRYIEKGALVVTSYTLIWYIGTWVPMLFCTNAH